MPKIDLGKSKNITSQSILRCGPDNVISGARAVAGLGTSLLELSQKLTFWVERFPSDLPAISDTRTRTRNRARALEQWQCIIFLEINNNYCNIVCMTILRCGPDMSGARAVAGLGTSLLELSQKLRCSLGVLMAWKERARCPQLLSHRDTQ